MKLSYLLVLFSTTLLSQVLGKQVSCLVNDEKIEVVDLDTGVCAFPLPSNLAVHFTFVSPNDYNIQYYYVVANDMRYTSSIRREGRTIYVPARYLYHQTAPVYEVHLVKTPASNSTEAFRRRFLKDVPLVKKDENDDFINSITDTDGTLVDNLVVAVEDVDSSSDSETSSPPPSTVTEQSTTIITITSCSNDICQGTTVPATLGPVTVTISDEVTVYTTYCPVSSVETVESTKVITITSCSDNQCSPATVEATPSTTTGTLHGVVTEYVTYCPISSTDVPNVSGGTSEIVGSTDLTTDVSTGPDVSAAAISSTGSSTSSDISVISTISTSEVSSTPDVSAASDVSATSDISTFTTLDTSIASGISTVSTEVDSSATSETESSSTSGSTVTEGSTEIITITACHNDICQGTTVPATLGPVTTTVHGETTIFTTYCPVSSIETVESSKVITVYACDKSTCHTTSVIATPSTTIGTLGTIVTEYVTYCPITSTFSGGESVVTDFVTSNGVTYIPKTTVEVSGESSFTITSLVSVPAISSTTNSVQTTVVTTTACYNDVCQGTTVPATPVVITSTVSGRSTVATIYSPVQSIETVQSSKTVSVQACNDHSCYIETVVATPSTAITTIEGGTTSEYVTYCPVTSTLSNGGSIVTNVITSGGTIYVPKPTTVVTGGTSYSATIYFSVPPITGQSSSSEHVVTVTACSNDICHPTTIPAALSIVTTTSAGSTIVYSTYCPVSSIETVESSKTVTVVACHDDSCYATTTIATPETGKSIVGSSTSEYVTYQPVVTPSGSIVVASSVITSSGITYVPETTVIESGESSHTTVSYISVSVDTKYQPTSTTVSVSSVISVVACGGGKCYATSAVVTPQTATTVISGTTSEYVTYQPPTASSGGDTFVTSLVTSEGITYVPQPSIVVSGSSSFETTNYISVSVNVPKTTLAAVSTSQSSAGPTPAITTYEAGASSSSSSFSNGLGYVLMMFLSFAYLI
ncbi:hypothetical protein G210_2588 [Candida maltosa Xu316]|uniref:Uncharacterized protein n=1 Tax=Candida maltosa (strain Xu316) TaxID=1245528 RepID=M3JXK6_CANMX|nr:hypothetical protein G210_2588 [Candida maltosa Xu316]